MIKIYYSYLEKAPADYAIPADLEFGYVSPRELRQIEMIHKDYGFWPMVNLMFRGEKCFAIKKDGQIQSFMMIGFREAYYGGTRIKLKSNEAHLYYSWTLKPFRGKGLAEILRMKVYSLLQAQGRDTFYSFTDRHNLSGLKFKDKINAQKLALYIFVRIWFLKFRIKLRDYAKEAGEVCEKSEEEQPRC